jgi:hypothetical protein
VAIFCYALSLKVPPSNAEMMLKSNLEVKWVRIQLSWCLIVVVAQSTSLFTNSNANLMSNLYVMNFCHQVVDVNGVVSLLINTLSCFYQISLDLNLLNAISRMQQLD